MRWVFCPSSPAPFLLGGSSFVFRLIHMHSGFFITFEGPDGSGKSTQIQWLAERLKGLGQTVLSTREPGGTEIGEEIRDLLHDLRHREMQPRAEILLYSAARAQLVGQVIRPCLAGGGTVLC